MNEGKVETTVTGGQIQGIAGAGSVVIENFTIINRAAGDAPAAEPGAEAILREELARGLDELPAGRNVMLKLTIPDVPNYYSPLIEHSRVTRVVALSGGYSRKDACRRLAANHGMIASFSRALVEDLRYPMSDTEFDTSLAKAIDEIYQASVDKV